MADEAGGGAALGATDDQMQEVRRLQELLGGRFTEEETLRLLEHRGWNLLGTVQFVFEGEPRDVRQISGSGDGWIAIRADHHVRNLAFRNDLPFQVRQFACRENDTVWWRKVPSRKLVSTCHRCRRRYEAVPREHEWGWARFVCGHCGNEFHGFGQINSTESQCYGCGRTCPVEEVIPPYRRQSSRRTQHQHSCSAPNCFNRTPGAVFRPTRCVHPRSLRHQVVYPSSQHNSTGSTVATFLSQGDLIDFEDYFGPRNMLDVPEEGAESA